jgi:hypothetical protein
MFKWIWGEKNQTYPLKFEAKPKEVTYTNKRIKLHMELNLNVPESVEVIEVMKDSKMNFELPFQSQLKNVSISHIEILS